MNDQNTPQPDTVGGAFVQALAPDQYGAYTARTAKREAAGTCGRALSTGQPCPDHPQQPETLTVTAAHVEAALRGWLACFDYDAHKYTECGEEDGEDHYPEEAADFFDRLRKVAGGEQR